MSRLVAFLRAINAGHHAVKMEILRQIFETLGFSQVEAFTASGNIIFKTDTQDIRALEKKIEKGLREELGYEVATFIRTEKELAKIANYTPFHPSDLDGAGELNIVFLAEALDDETKQKLLAFSTDIDEFRVHGREIY